MIAAHSLTKEYSEKRGAFDVSFTVGSGEVVGFLGQNGAGKSTVLSMLAGCTAPDRGAVEVCGISMAEEPLKAKARIGYLPERPPLYADMTVWEYLSFAFALKRIRGSKHDAVSDALKEAGITDVKQRIIGRLSKGYQQRVGIAQALIGQPDVLLLDEPTVGLDPTQLLEFRQLLSDLQAERAILLSSHILSEIQAVCGRVLLLHAGRIVADDATGNLVKAFGGAGRFLVRARGNEETVLAAVKGLPGVQQVRSLGEREADCWDVAVTPEAGSDPREAVGRCLLEQGLYLRQMQPLLGELEDMFLEVTRERGQEL